MALSKILENSITDGVVSSAKLKDFSAAVDLNGVELILDADQDTSITADTDDRIDFKIANVEHFSFSNSSGDTVVKPMVDAKDIIFQQYDGNKILEINDGNYVGIGGNAAGAATLPASQGVQSRPTSSHSFRARGTKPDDLPVGAKSRRGGFNHLDVFITGFFQCTAMAFRTAFTARFTPSLRGKLIWS